MGIINSITDGLDSFIHSFAKGINQDIVDHVDIETAVNPYTLVSADGSLVSIIRLDGIKGIYAGSELDQQIFNPLNSLLGSYLDKKDHAIQVFFSMDNERIKDELRRILAGAFDTAQKLSLDANDILEERIKNLSRLCSVEESFVVLWTTPSSLTSQEKKRMAAEKSELAKAADISRPKTPSVGQNLLVGYEALNNRHEAFIKMMEQDFSGLGISVKKLSVREGLRSVRKSIDPQWTAYNWEPRLPGDKILPKQTRIYPSGKEEYDLMWPKIGWQVAPRKAIEHDNQTVVIGDKIYAPIYIDLFQKEEKTFSALLSRLINQDDIPWRISYMISGDGMGILNFKKMGSSLLKKISLNNELIAKGIEELKSLQSSQEAIVKLQICLCTWADAGEVDLVKRRKQILARAVEGWGGCEVSEVSGDPLTGFMSSALSVSRKTIATPTAAPLLEVVKSLPLNRPASIWERGAVLFRSPDGKILPFQPGSSKQSTWISLAFARPGSGKSVLMNVINFALCLSDNLAQLPRIAIIDVGPSSAGLISLIKESLPENQRHFVTYERLRNTKEYAINIFDTQLGARYPLPSHLTFLQNMVTLLATDPSEDKPDKGMIGLVVDVIAEAYREMSDKNNPKRYAENIVPEVDAFLRENNIPRDSKTTWWEIVDTLFDMGQVYLATKANYHAVPTLADLPRFANSEKMRQKYEMSVEGTGETLIGAFSRMISNAQDMYPILAYTTNFDLGESRIVAIDLDEVARSGGVAGSRQAQIMYMLARQACSGDFYLNPDDINSLPVAADQDIPEHMPFKKYKEFHTKKITGLREDLKRVCYDEFHRTSGSEIVRQQVIQDMREGRKWNVDIMLSSQEIKDFDEVMISFATSVFILDPGTPENVNLLADKFGLSGTETYVLKNQVRPPRPEGTTFFARFTTTEGAYSSLLTLTVGAMEMWALNTTVESVAIRRRLYERIGPKKARQILAVAFPGGSAKSYVEERKAELANSSSFISEEETENIYDTIANELIRNYVR